MVGSTNGFDFYETVGIVIPGAIALVGAAAVSPTLDRWLLSGAISLGDFGLLLMLSYATGHLVHGVGNMLEALVYRGFGGSPSDWPRLGREGILSQSQCNRLVHRLRERDFIPVSSLRDISEADWRGIVIELAAMTRATGQTRRLDSFNRTYGLLRGLAAALLLVLLFLVASSGTNFSELWQVKVALLLGFAVALYRMHRFSCHYARELFVQFLRLASVETPPSDGFTTTREEARHV